MMIKYTLFLVGIVIFLTQIVIENMAVQMLSLLLLMLSVLLDKHIEKPEAQRKFRLFVLSFVASLIPIVAINFYDSSDGSSIGSAPKVLPMVIVIAISIYHAFIYWQTAQQRKNANQSY